MKDYSAILGVAWDYDVAYDNYLNNPEEDTFEVARKLGLLDSSGEDNERLAMDINRKVLDLI